MKPSLLPKRHAYPGRTDYRIALIETEHSSAQKWSMQERSSARLLDSWPYILLAITAFGMAYKLWR
jgi:hypothetical protein